MRGDQTLFLFVWAEDENRPTPNALADQRAEVRERFQHSGWECRVIIDAMERANDLYLDRVSQIRMPHWSKGRVALVGDAAYCVSLLAGQGSALAMIGATILAGELHVASGDHAAAFARYEQRLQGFITNKQRAAERFASSFAPRTALGLFVRNQLSKTLSLPYVAEWVLGRDLRDAIEVPTYV